jgi:hypothetical protein
MTIAKQKRRKLFPSKSRLQNYFQTPGRKCKTQSALPCNTARSQSQPCFSHALKVSARKMQPSYTAAVSIACWAYDAQFAIAF